MQNTFLVGVNESAAGKKIILGLPPRGPMSEEEALNLAAWIIGLLDPYGDKTVSLVEKVLET